MAPIIDRMLEKSFKLIDERDLGRKKAVRTGDDQVDTLRREIVAYLTKMAKKPLSNRESQLQVAYLFIASELENLADVIEQNILDRAKKLIGKELHFSADGMEDVRSLFNIVKANFASAMSSLEKEEAAEARVLLHASEASWELQRDLRIKHFKRLNEGVQVSLETTEIHMDLLNDLHRINRHVYHIAQTIVELSEGAEKGQGEEA
jgi:phosphate:Na+ symporter